MKKLIYIIPILFVILGVTRAEAGISFVAGGAVQNSATSTQDFIGAGNMTICAWAWMSTAGTSNKGTIFSNGKVLLQIRNANNSMAFSRDNATFANSGAASLQGATSTWTHWCAVSNSSGTTNMYKNGVLSGAANQSAGTPAAPTFAVTAIGQQSTTFSSEWNGCIEKVKIFRQLLTQAQIVDVMRGGNPYYPLDWWPLWHYNGPGSYSIDKGSAHNHLQNIAKTSGGLTDCQYHSPFSIF